MIIKPLIKVLINHYHLTVNSVGTNEIKTDLRSVASNVLEALGPHK